MVLNLMNVLDIPRSLFLEFIWLELFRQDKNCYKKNKNKKKKQGRCSISWK